MTVLNVMQLLTFVAALGLFAYAVIAPREANPTKRERRTHLYLGASMVALAAFTATLALDSAGWSSYLKGVLAAGFLVVGLMRISKSRRLSR
ncbi:hypothetical protein ACAG24_012405 [Mycobacterium sp. pW049]|uniref:hypothetical protein n=1 Tax=[Mycobacterium] bulgaricum TaxID=3238985 RepID=UPI00351B5EC6